MRRARWPLIGLATGTAAGWLWGWSASDYEAIDSAVGTGFLGALAGLLIGAIAARRKDRDEG